jgi:LysM repeat protein
MNAIKNGANSGSLVNQLYAGKSSAFSTPTALNNFTASVSSTPPAQAATSSVKSNNAPSNASIPTQTSLPSATFNGQQVSGAPGSIINGGNITQNDTQPGSQNGIQVGGPGYVAPTTQSQTYTTPSGATVNSQGQTLSTPQIFSGLIGSLTGTASGNIPIGQNAADIASSYGKKIADVNTQAAGLENAYGTTPGMAFPTSQGLSQAAASTAGQIEQGLAAGESAALQGTAQQLTAQNQAQSGLTSAGQLASPSNTNVTPPAGGVTTNTLTGQQYSNPIYEPATGAYGAISPQPGGTAGQPPTAGQATQYQIQSGDTFNSIATKYGTTVAALEAANPGMNPTDLQTQQQGGAPMVIPASTAGGGTPFAGGVASGNAQLGQQYSQNNATISSAKGLQTQLTNDINTYGINSLSPVNLANAFTLWVGGNLSNQGQGQFFQDLTDYTMTLAPLIGINGTQTDAKNYIANSMIPATNSGQTILGLAQNLYNNAVIKNNAIGGIGQGNVPQSNTQTAPTTQAPQGSTPSKLGGYYTTVNGKTTYVAQ